MCIPEMIIDLENEKYRKECYICGKKAYMGKGGLAFCSIKCLEEYEYNLWNNKEKK